MSSNSSKLILSSLLAICIVGCTNKFLLNNNTKKIISQKEDLNILLALDSVYLEQYDKALKHYMKLYNLTDDEKYLKLSVQYAYLIKDFEFMGKISKIGMDEFRFNYQFYLKQYIVSLLGMKQYDEALKESKILLDKYNSELSYKLVANIYYIKNDYKNSLKYFESAYTKKQTVETLLKLTDLMYTYLDKKEIAVAYLETYLQTNNCDKDVCNKLILIYQEQGDVDGMLGVLNKTYKKYIGNHDIQKAKKIQIIIATLLEKQSIDKAIDYLEKNSLNNIKLLSLYEQKNDMQKALLLTRKIYKKTKKPEYLGRLAMLEFELANDKQKVMKHVIANFELALSSGINNASFQNYYGYLLIDYELDIPKGISLVKQALVNSPNNIAYIDSLAWGYYKLKRCQKAITLMKKVVNQIGIDDNEIKNHWNKIKNCKIKKGE